MTECQACGRFHRNVDGAAETVPCVFCDTPSPVDGQGRSLAPLHRDVFPDYPQSICVGCSKTIEGMSELSHRRCRQQYPLPAGAKDPTKESRKKREAQDDHFRLKAECGRAAADWWVEEGGYEAAFEHLKRIDDYFFEEEWRLRQEWLVQEEQRMAGG